MASRSSGGDNFDLPPTESRGARSSLLPLTVLWVIFDIAGVLAGGRGFHHYFLAAVPGLSITAGLAFSLLWAGGRRQEVAQVVFSLLVLGPLAMRQVVEAGEFVRHRGVDSRETSWRVIASRLRSISRPGDTLFTWDYLPGIYFESGIRNANRWLDAHYLSDLPGKRASSGRQLLDELNRDPPTFVVMREPTSPRGGSKSDKAPDRERAEFGQWLGRHFSLIDESQGLGLYRRLEGAGENRAGGGAPMR
jgi:hypothetical protein